MLDFVMETRSFSYRYLGEISLSIHVENLPRVLLSAGVQNDPEDRRCDQTSKL